MNITCPKCNFSRTVDQSKIPDRPVKVHCPKCGEAFALDKAQRQDDTASSRPGPVAPEQIACPACGMVQARGERCHGCGVIYTKLKARQAESGAGHGDVAMGNGIAERLRDASDPAPRLLPKAGFWIRVVAYVLDFLLLWTVEYLLSLLIGLTVGLLGLSAEGDPSIEVVIWLFSAALSIGYAVFFTGYCGQTPGKMALRIKVIRTDGSPLGYGRAALREVLGKLISGILLGIGYLMVAFDSQKQGLHDKIADTYVIKL
jgi:predicted Zn finger-like uncharacterized protein